MLLGVSSSHLKTWAAFGRVSRWGKAMLLPVAHSWKYKHQSCFSHHLTTFSQNLPYMGHADICPWSIWSSNPFYTCNFLCMSPKWFKSRHSCMCLLSEWLSLKWLSPLLLTSFIGFSVWQQLWHWTMMAIPGLHFVAQNWASIQDDEASSPLQDRFYSLELATFLCKVCTEDTSRYNLYIWNLASTLCLHSAEATGVDRNAHSTAFSWLQTQHE